MTTIAAPPYTRRWAALAVLSASLLLIMMDLTILNVALPEISAELKPGAVELLWIVDVYSLVVAGLLVTASALGDRWGRKRMLIAGFAAFGLASAAALFVTSSAMLIAVRALLGIGGAMIMPSTLSMIRSLFTDPKERATALGIWAAMASAGGALGPILGGLLLEAFSWHAAFLVNVPIMVIAIIAGLILLPEVRNPRPGRWDALGTVLSMTGMVAFIYAIKHLAKNGIDAWTLGSAAVALITLAWFVRRCLRRPDPLLEIRLFRSRAFTAGILVALVSAVTMTAVMLLMAQWIQLVQGFSPLQAGLFLLPTAVVSAIISPMAPSLAHRVGPRPVLIGGLVAMALGFLMLWLTPLTYGSVVASMVLVGIGTGPMAIASAVIMSGTPEDKAGSAAALEETSYDIGGTLGVATLGSLAAALYRGDLPAGAGEAARESIGGAIATGTPDVIAAAKQAFADSLAVTSLCGAVLILAFTALVWWLTPRGLNLHSVQH
ncbi:MFS transporter [Kibdelosporangium aridum]|uniref:MFS transporter n=1 Tax=Kibdelosporangium aridum TaxID=2030 RepID=A0A428ZCC2_KIBAR|nr:MFS transporter [Kibdelosporangium aridum]RSM85737.1 MFS transporter [Kibdelosporangium aridum]